MAAQESKLLAIDPSLQASGWALFSVDSRKPLAFGVLSPQKSYTILAERLNDLQQKVEALIVDLKLSVGDVLVCEGPAPLVLNPQSALKVEHVRGIFEVVARSRGVHVPGRVNPRTVQSEVLGMRGKQLARAEVKLWAREIAEKLFADQMSEMRNAPVNGTVKGRSGTHQVSQDVVDALLIGVLALSRIDLALKTGVSLAAAFAPQFYGARAGSRRGYGKGWRNVGALTATEEKGGKLATARVEILKAGRGK